MPDLADGSGQSAMDVAEDANDQQLLALLAMYGAVAAAPAPETEGAAGGR